MLSADGMVDTGNPALHEAPKALNRVGMDISAHVDLGLVLNAPVLVAALAEFGKLSPLVCVDKALSTTCLLTSWVLDVARGPPTCAVLTRPFRSTAPKTAVLFSM